MSNLSKEILDAFLPEKEIISISELVSGHINDTYLVKPREGQQYIIQRINNAVFKDVPGLIRNKTLVSKHLHKKMSGSSQEIIERSVLTFLPSTSGSYFFKDKNGDFWNGMIYIDNSQTFEIVTDASIAYEGGKLFGEFLNLTEDFNASELIEVIPQFHDMSFRFSQFEASLIDASEQRLFLSAHLIKRVKGLKKEMHILQDLKEKGKIRLRVTHNDTKISNALFDMQGKGLCVIDTDTIMPGIIHYDFGDAIRTICNTAAEDEKDLDRVNFNGEFYEAYRKGFLEKMNTSISDLEKQYLPLGAKTMIFIMGIRFLTDYLNGDKYYKINYPEHNLVRAKNQFKLIESFEEEMGIVS
ncbi:phosphotransferase [Lutimonas halocynthiae]|uniref:phosphotransferase n=1 Tax=Lutimonas halocynthiae TaxID=1446477 RepID=UPI0025B57798|nr:phosphotransferase [Lutimonas halocynthiae]MDN3641312.1 phosphotransferase [Lutimonas halocynthiae]